MKMRIIIGSILSLAAVALADPGTYQSPESFVAEAFPNGAPDAKALWLNPDLRETVADVLDRAPMPRVRYWQRQGRTAWVLEEIGKDEPITAGVVVQDGAIEDVRVLVFRESRGWEIKYPFFTRQFEHARLGHGGRLDRSIDGITGATLSVNAMTRMARVALLLDAQARAEASDVARAAR